MSYTSKRDRERIAFAASGGEQDAGGAVITEAEFYLAVGRTVRRRLRGGSPPRKTARSLGLPVADALAALRYAESSPASILPALVEDWSWRQIKASLPRPLTATDPAPLKH